MLTGAGIFLACFAAYLRVMTPGIALEDSGEFATAAVTLSLTHPPGYPLYLLAGKLFSLLPLGSPGFRLALLSASCAALAAALLYSFVRKLAGPGSGTSAAFASLAFAGTPALALQAAIPDKYALSTALACALFLLCALAWKEGRKWLPHLAFLFGLALAHHMTALYIAPAVLALWWRERGWRERRLTSLLLALFAAGVSLKPAVLTILSQAAPSLMYDRLDSWDKLSGYLAATSYSGRFVAYTAGQKAARLWTHGVITLWREAGPLILAAAAVGAVRAWSAWRPVLACGAGGAAFGFVLVANFQIAGVDYYLLPLTAFLCALAGAGLDLLRRPAGRWGVAAAGLLLAASTSWKGLPKADVSRYYGAIDWGRDIVSCLDRDAVLLSLHDDDFFPVLYLTRVLDERPDVVIMHRPMLTRLWYHAQVERLHPGFKALDPGIIPWGETVEPDMLINIFIRSHIGKREIAFTYIPGAELAGGYTGTPEGCVFRLGRREDRKAPPRAAEFARYMARFRMRHAFTNYGGKGFRFKEVAGAFSASWTQLAVLWWNREDANEARACLRHALAFPYTRVDASDFEHLRTALFGFTRIPNPVSPPKAE